MELRDAFMTRHNALYNFWLGVVWEDVPDDLFRQRPDPRVNSIAWNIWHLTRVEDSAMNRFVTNRTQVLDTGDWMDKMNLPLRHNGFGMTFEEVDDLNRKINLAGLRAYSDAVQLRTREIIQRLEPESLDDVLDVEHLRIVLFDEGLAVQNLEGAGLLENYTGWTKGMFLMNHGLTHSFHHIGEINVIASLLGLES